MPTLSFFHGILIQMYWDDHPPPRFHARYAGRTGRFTIDPLGVLTSDLPPATERMVLKWAQLHQAELLESWNVCRNDGTPSKIQGLP